jgi:hypothetical protein
MTDNKTIFQRVWGVALILAGIGIFVMLPQKMAQLEEMGYTLFYLRFTRFSFYLIAVMLIGGGGMKLYRQMMPTDKPPGRTEESK